MTLDPFEAYSPLAVDSDRPLTTAISLQDFQSISWRHSQILNPNRGIDQLQFP
jgi:hypothetical protein